MGRVVAELAAVGQRLLPWLRLLQLYPRHGVAVVWLPLLAALLLADAGAHAPWHVVASLAVALLWWSASWGYFSLLGGGAWLELHHPVAVHRLFALVVVVSVTALSLSMLLDARMALLLLLPMSASVLYPWLLRRSYLADGVLALGVAALVTLVEGSFGLWPTKSSWLLTTALLPWVVAWRVVQRWPHYREDGAHGVRSLAAMFGPACPALVAGLLLFSLLGWWLLGQQAQPHSPFVIGWVSALLVAVGLYLTMVRYGTVRYRLVLFIHTLFGAVLVSALGVSRVMQ